MDLNYSVSSNEDKKTRQTLGNVDSFLAKRQNYLHFYLRVPKSYDLNKTNKSSWLIFYYSISVLYLSIVISLTQTFRE